MSTTLIYIAIALSTLVLVGYLVHQREADDDLSGESGRPGPRLGFLDASELGLAERIFDSTDYVWLRDEAGFPSLARRLVSRRKRLALLWLEALRSSFDDLIRIPESEQSMHTASGVPEGWRLLWLTFRFHVVLGYAIFVVRYLGPYHRLVLSLDLSQLTPEWLSQHRSTTAAGTARSQH